MIAQSISTSGALDGLFAMLGAGLIIGTLLLGGATAAYLAWRSRTRTIRWVPAKVLLGFGLAAAILFADSIFVLFTVLDGASVFWMAIPLFGTPIVQSAYTFVAGRGRQNER